MARYKARVLKRFPSATPIVMTSMPDGSPYHITIHVDGSPLDIHALNDRQLHGAAWRSAYYWCVRNPPGKQNWLDKQLEAARSTVESWSDGKRTALKSQIQDIKRG